MDQVHVVRHKVLVDGRTQRSVARELGLSRTTVGKYVGQAAPVRKPEAGPRPRPVWDAVAERVQALLTDSVRWTGGKQQLTATRLHELLRAEGQRVGVTVVKDAVAEWRRQRREVFVPLTYRPGDLAEVDFFEVLVDIDGSDVALPGATGATLVRPALTENCRKQPDDERETGRPPCGRGSSPFETRSPIYLSSSFSPA